MKKFLALVAAYTTIFTFLFISNKTNAQGYGNVIFMGSSNSGKTGIIRCIAEKYNANYDFLSDKINIEINDANDKVYKIGIYDITFDERLRSFSISYIRNSGIAVIVCSYSSAESLEAVCGYVNLLKSYNSNCRVIIVASHAELEKNKRAFTAKKVLKMGKSLNAVDVLTDVSCVDGRGIEGLEKSIVKNCDFFMQPFCSSLINTYSFPDDKVRTKKKCLLV